MHGPWSRSRRNLLSRYVLHCDVLRLAKNKRTERWQVYIPAINWLLLTLAIIAVLAFKTTDAIGNAYGERALHGPMRPATACACLACTAGIRRWRWRWRWRLSRTRMFIWV